MGAEALATFLFVIIIHVICKFTENKIILVALIATGLYASRIVASKKSGASLNPTISFILVIC